jgi:hypothetical protein
MFLPTEVSVKAAAMYSKKENRWLYNVFMIRSRMEYRAFLFHKLKKKQAQKLEKIQYRAIRGALGYQSSTPTNVMLAEAKGIPMFSRFRQLGRNYVSRCYTSTNHPMVQLLEELSILVEEKNH